MQESDRQGRGFRLGEVLQLDSAADIERSCLRISNQVAGGGYSQEAEDQLPKARETIDWFKQTLGAENFYLELQNHGIPEQAKVNRHLIPWAKEFGLKLVATNDVHYVEKDHSHAHDCLVCIGTQSMLSDPKRMSAGYAKEQFYLRSATSSVFATASGASAKRAFISSGERR